MENRFDILNADSAALDFLDEWLSKEDFVVAHTSGSTGSPKAIRLLKSDMIASAKATVEFFKLSDESLLHCPLSCQYIAGKMMLVRALVAGCRVDFSKELISGHGAAELTSVVPAQIQQLLDLRSSERFPGRLLIGGAPLPEFLESKLIESRVEAYVSYGMTETCSHVALRQLGSKVYEALPGYSFSIDDRNCLIVNSTRLSFGSLTTNDVVELVDSTGFIWRGRADNAINSGGVKVFPEEIEKLLRPWIPADIDFYITSCQHGRWGEAVILVSNRQIELPAEAITRLKPAQRPKKLIVDNIIFTSNKKLLRRRYNDYKQLN